MPSSPSIARRTLLAGTAAAGALAAWVQPAFALPARRVDRLERLADGARLFTGEEVVQVRLRAQGVASVIRCARRGLASAGGFFGDSGISGEVRFEESATELRLAGDGIAVIIDKRSGALRFADTLGRELIAEAEPPAPLPGVPAGRRQGFRIGRTERLHGLGQFREPYGEYRDRDVFLAQANSDAITPMLVSTGGWGLLWDTGTAAWFRSRGDVIGFQSIADDLIRYHVCIGDGMDGVIRGYRALTGQAALLPRWAYGYWQSKESYLRQEELTSVVEEYRRRKLPLDTVVLDFRYWTDESQFSGMRFDPERFPDPAAMVRQVHAADAHLIASIWPAFGVKTELYRAMAAGNFLLPGDHWSGSKLFDASNPEAREIYWRAIKRGLIDIGVDGLWTDGNEPELRSTGERYGTAASYAANGRIAAGPIDSNLLTYSWYQAKGLSEAMRRDVPDRRPVILTRSSHAGQQAFGAITWSGDIFASWGTLGNQILAAQNFSMSGTPWWTCDIGAFLVHHRYPRGLEDPAYKELYVRWFQFGAFLPVFRAHGTQIARELWQFGEPGTPFFDSLETALRQRYTLMPYIYSVAAGVALDGDTLLRPLVMDYADQPAVCAQTATFLFGRDLLVRVIDRPFFHASENMQEFLPNYVVQGIDAPAATIEYYEGANFDRFVSRRLTDDIKLSWPGDLPKSLEGKPYSLRWTGRIVAQESGPTRISLIGKGAMRLMLEGKIVVEGSSGVSVADDANGAVSFRGHEGDAFLTADVVLEGGRAYDFSLEQRQETPNAVSLWFEWITPSIRQRQQLPEEKKVSIALPAGRDWYDFRTGTRFRGGHIVKADADLSHHPLFARAGAILPLSEGIDRSGPLPETLPVRVYAGHDGKFTLYDDAGDGNGYLRGEYARIPMRWDDAARKLTIGARVGRYPGMRERLGFRVMLVDGAGACQERMVDYAGEPVSSEFGVRR